MISGGIPINIIMLKTLVLAIFLLFWLRMIPEYSDNMSHILRLHVGLRHFLLHWIILLKHKQHIKTHLDISQSNTKMVWLRHQNVINAVTLIIIVIGIGNQQRNSIGILLMSGDIKPLMRDPILMDMMRIRHLWSRMQQ